MSIAQAYLAEFEHEVKTTRRFLERVPADRLDWRPHEKSMTLGRLAQHVATIPRWGAAALTQSEADVAANRPPEVMTTRAELLATFDQHVAATRAALVGRGDGELMAPWTLKREGHTVFSMPRASVWRTLMMNHLIHHRAQLGVYLRMHDVPLPSMYGPSADEDRP